MTAIRQLYDAWVEADKAWVAEIGTAFPTQWPGDVRYGQKGIGEPGTALRAAWDKCQAAELAFKAAGGNDWLQGKVKA